MAQQSANKVDTAPTVTEKAIERPTSQASKDGPAVSMNGGLFDLMLGAFLPCVPVVVVTSILLTVILHNRVEIDPGWPVLQTPTTGNLSDPVYWNSTLKVRAMRGGNAAYWVRFNPAALAAIASWSSRIIPFLTGSSMAVIAFFAARRVLHATKHNRPEELPTPHQMSILIKLLSGAGAKPLWDTVKYRWQNHERLAKPIPLAFGALSYLFVITFLISAADTWFAVATKPMNVELVSRHTTAVSTYGRNLNPSMCNGTLWQQKPCPSNSQATCNFPCSVENWNFTTGNGMSQKDGIKGAEESAKTLLSNSYINNIQNISNPPDYQSEQFYYLADVGIGQALDFMANTTAVKTQCQIITQNCQISSTDETFSCGDFKSSLTFSGQIGVDPDTAMSPEDMSSVGIQFFDRLQQPIGLGNQTTNLFPNQNPINFLAWSKGFPPIDTSSQDFAGMRAGNYLRVDHSGDNVFMLNCTSTIHHVTYAWVNSSVLRADDHTNQSFYPSLAPDSYGAIFSAPFSMNSALGHVALHNAAALAAYLTTPEALAKKFANEFSRAAVALTAGVMTPTVSMIEQSRNNTELLTRVPKAPLYFLVSLKALYALASLTVALLAVFLTNPAEAQEVKARLTIDGLAVGVFEPQRRQETAVSEMEELYGEHHRAEQRLRGDGEVAGDQGVHKVGMKQAPSGGWVWVAGGKLSRTWSAIGWGKAPTAGGKRSEESVDGKEL